MQEKCWRGRTFVEQNLRHHERWHIRMHETIERIQFLIHVWMVSLNRLRSWSRLKEKTMDQLLWKDLRVGERADDGRTILRWKVISSHKNKPNSAAIYSRPSDKSQLINSKGTIHHPSIIHTTPSSNKSIKQLLPSMINCAYMIKHSTDHISDTRVIHCRFLSKQDKVSPQQKETPARITIEGVRNMLCAQEGNAAYSQQCHDDYKSSLLFLKMKASWICQVLNAVYIQ